MIQRPPVYAEFVDIASNTNGIRILPQDLKLSGNSRKNDGDRYGFKPPILLASTQLPRGVLATDARAVRNKVIVAEAFKHHKNLEPRSVPSEKGVGIRNQKEQLQTELEVPSIDVQELENLDNLYQEYLDHFGACQWRIRSFYG